MTVKLYRGDCLKILKRLPAGSVDAVVTDPPYALKFMGKRWDAGLPDPMVWQECLRVLKPGAYLLAFGGTRTYHRLICSIEDAGFEIRDCLMWMYGQGFPKGRGCLKPAWEPITLARKPGGKVRPLGINECRVEAPEGLTTGGNFKGSSPLPMNRVSGKIDCRQRSSEHPAGRWPPNVLLQHHADCVCTGSAPVRSNGHYPAARGKGGYSGRFTGQADLAERSTAGEQQLIWNCHPDCVVRMLGEQSVVAGVHGAGLEKAGDEWEHGFNPSESPAGLFHSERRPHSLGDSGTAARFFPQFRYAAKASRRERNRGCEGMKVKYLATMNDGIDTREHNENQATAYAANNHPTVKPLAIMEWLIRLACPAGGLVLDPFLGSGSTGVACQRLGRNFIGVEIDPGYHAIAKRRIAAATAETVTA